jgi:hypothetical protein
MRGFDGCGGAPLDTIQPGGEEERLLCGRSLPCQ